MGTASGRAGSDGHLQRMNFVQGPSMPQGQPSAAASGPQGDGWASGRGTVGLGVHNSHSSWRGPARKAGIHCQQGQETGLYPEGQFPTSDGERVHKEWEGWEVGHGPLSMHLKMSYEVQQMREVLGRFVLVENILESNSQRDVGLFTTA